MVHPSDEELEQLALIGGSSTAMTWAAEHLRECDDCGQRLRQHQLRLAKTCPPCSSKNGPWDRFPGRIERTKIRNALLNYTDDFGSGHFTAVEESVDRSLQQREGSFGTVFRAVGRAGLPRAVKVFDGCRVPTEAVWEELRCLEHLNHPGVVKVFSSGKLELQESHDSSPREVVFFEMAWVEGVSMQELLNARPQSWSRQQVLRWIRELASILAHLHQQGVLHGDLKPANMIVTPPHSQLTLIDFGVGWCRPGGTPALPARGWSPAYAAPEVTAGQPLTTSADVYSLACVASELSAASQISLPPRLQTLLTQALTGDSASPLQGTQGPQRPTAAELEFVAESCWREEARRGFVLAVAGPLIIGSAVGFGTWSRLRPNESARYLVLGPPAELLDSLVVVTEFRTAQSSEVFVAFHPLAAGPPNIQAAPWEAGSPVYRLGELPVANKHSAARCVAIHLDSALAAELHRMVADACFQSAHVPAWQDKLIQRFQRADGSITGWEDLFSFRSAPARFVADWLASPELLSRLRSAAARTCAEV